MIGLIMIIAPLAIPLLTAKTVAEYLPLMSVTVPQVEARLKSQKTLTTTSSTHIAYMLSRNISVPTASSTPAMPLPKSPTADRAHRREPVVVEQEDQAAKEIS